MDREKLAVISDCRRPALIAATKVGAPRLARGMYKGRNLGAYLSPLRERRWRGTGSVFTQRMVRASKRLVRIARLRRAAGRGVDKLYTAGIRPCTEYGAAIHNVSPIELERLERLTARGVAPTSKGVSRTANMVYTQEPLLDPMLACMRQSPPVILEVQAW